MKLLLDEMHAPAVAGVLREAGYDAIAVKERPEMTGLPDSELLAAALAEGRVLVTENVKDFAVLDQQWAAAGRRHAGLVFTHPRRFPRTAGNSSRRLADALQQFVDTEARSLRKVESFVWWLESVSGRGLTK